MDTSLYPPTSIPLSDSPLSLFSTPSASQEAFNAMMEGANRHHNSVVYSVLNSEPIKESIVAKDSFALKERLSSPHSIDVSNHSVFPSIQADRGQSNRPQQADLALLSSPSSPCSPQALQLAAAGSSFSQKSMDLMHLSPPLMEKLEADLALLQKKYGLVSQALTPARLSHQGASSVQADLHSSKQAALGTFLSPLRHNNVNTPLALRTEVPFALLAMNSSSPNQSPPSLSTNFAQISKIAIPARETASPARTAASPARKNVVPAPYARPKVTSTVPALAPAPPPAARPNDTSSVPVPAPSARPNVTSSVPVPAPSARPNVTSTEPNPHARETAHPAAQNGYASSSAQISSVFFRGKAHTTAHPTVSGNPRGSVLPAVQNGTASAQICSAPDRGNVPMQFSATQCTMPVQASSWAARLGGSRFTSSTPLSYIPPTLIAGGTIAGVAVACRASYLRRVLASRLSIQTCGHF